MKAKEFEPIVFQKIIGKTQSGKEVSTELDADISGFTIEELEEAFMKVMIYERFVFSKFCDILDKYESTRYKIKNKMVMEEKMKNKNPHPKIFKDSEGKAIVPGKRYEWNSKNLQITFNEHGSMLLYDACRLIKTLSTVAFKNDVKSFNYPVPVAS